MKQLSLEGMWTEKAAQWITFVMAMGRQGIVNKKWPMLVCLNLTWLLQDQAVISALLCSILCQIRAVSRTGAAEVRCAFCLAAARCRLEILLAGSHYRDSCKPSPTVMTYRKHLTAELCGRLLLTFTEDKQHHSLVVLQVMSNDMILDYSVKAFWP